MTAGPFADFIDDGLGEVIDRGDGYYNVVFERRLKKPIGKVWAALTVPERLADWFAIVELDPRLGGHYRFSFADDPDNVVDGVIVEFEPLRRLAHTWPDKDHPDSIIRYVLEPAGDGCRLTFTQTGLPRMYLGAVAGWHAFLQALPGAADGVRTPWSAAHEAEILARYQLPA